MKVSEAEKLICPFMSIGFAADTSNLRSGGLIECNCITTNCMAWKFKKVNQTYKDISRDYMFSYPSNAIDELGYNKDQVLEWTVYTNDGYCQRLKG